ncbi:endonuclease/exonuclease/phosphatase family protein [Scytonema sp. NUACC21]
MPAINLSSPYTQNFDLLASTGTANTWTDDFTISGWYSTRPSYIAGTGSNNTGTLYSFGSSGSSERALGSVASGGTNTIYYGARFVNDTTSTITSLNLGYTGEQWRNGGSSNSTPSVAQKLDFQYQIGATNLTSGTWVDFDTLDFTSPVFGTTTSTALDGNLAANRVNLSSTLSGINLAPGQEIWLRWQDVNDANNDHGLGIDDFSITTGVTPPPIPTVTIQATNAAAAEALSEPGTFRITRTGDTSAALSVNYSVAGTATNGTDYTPNLTGTASIAAGQSFVDITITPVDDSAVEGNETVTLTLADTADYDLGNSSTATVTIADNEIAPTIRIHDIQGAAHVSPLNGQSVTNVPGTVTVVRNNGFYLEDPNPDNNDATSEGIFVFTSSAPTVAVGDSVLISGTVNEFRPGGNNNNLSTTQIITPSITTLSSNNSLPSPTVISAASGNNVRTIPTQVINNDAVNGDVEGSLFDPSQDGIDFYESLEGMRVQINNPVTTGLRTNFEELYVIPDSDAGVTGQNSRGGITISGNNETNVGNAVTNSDFNPERIQIDDSLNPGGITVPNVNVGTQLDTIVGVVNYDFGSYEVLPTTSPTVAISSPLTKEVTGLTSGSDQLTIATFNVENLDPGDGATRFNALANAIVSNLQSPDIISLEEIQDNNGATNDSVVDASQTFQTLIDAIAAAGGPTYQFRQINPVDDTNGGEPGGNIRVGFLFNPNRVSFVDRPGGSSTTNTTVTNASGAPLLSDSPGLIDPTNSAFNSSRKPLVGEFIFNGHTVFAIGNHFTSRGGSQPLFGRNQPPTQGGQDQRESQAAIVNNFVDRVLAADSNANVAVLGDFNEFQFFPALQILKGNVNGEQPVLTNLTDTLPVNERYTYYFDGNAQALDHILVSENLFNNLNGYDVVHINSEFTDQLSDHDPIVSRFNLPSIRGTSGRDTLSGGSGNDTIIGGSGGDALTGGVGNDRFVYTNIRDRGDTISDFEVGNDKLVFTQLLGSLIPEGYGGTNAIADGYVRVVQGSNSNNFSVEVDSDASGVADIFRPFITVNTVGADTLNSSSNFIF